MPRGRLVISYRMLEEIHALPEGSQIQWVEDDFERSILIIYVDHPDIPKVKPGKLFPEMILTTNEGENWEWASKERMLKDG